MKRAMARAIIHNSDYKSPDEAKAAIDRYFEERNRYFNASKKGRKQDLGQREDTRRVLTMEQLQGPAPRLITIGDRPCRVPNLSPYGLLARSHPELPEPQSGLHRRSDLSQVAR